MLIPAFSFCTGLRNVQEMRFLSSRFMLAAPTLEILLRADLNVQTNQIRAKHAFIPEKEEEPERYGG